MLYSLLICQVGTKPGQSKTNFSCVTTETSVEAQDTHTSYFLA